MLVLQSQNSPPKRKEFELVEEKQLGYNESSFLPSNLSALRDAKLNSPLKQNSQIKEIKFQQIPKETSQDGLNGQLSRHNQKQLLHAKQQLSPHIKEPHRKEKESNMNRKDILNEDQKSPQLNVDFRQTAYPTPTKFSREASWNKQSNSQQYSLQATMTIQTQKNIFSTESYDSFNKPKEEFGINKRMNYPDLSKVKSLSKQQFQENLKNKNRASSQEHSNPFQAGPYTASPFLTRIHSFKKNKQLPNVFKQEMVGDQNQLIEYLGVEPITEKKKLKTIIEKNISNKNVEIYYQPSLQWLLLEDQNGNVKYVQEEINKSIRQNQKNTQQIIYSRSSRAHSSLHKQPANSVKGYYYTQNFIEPILHNVSSVEQQQNNNSEKINQLETQKQEGKQEIPSISLFKQFEKRNWIQIDCNRQANLSNGMYKYVVNYGNNCTIVKRVMKTRDNWYALKSHDMAYNFRWCPVSDGVKFDRLGVGMKQLLNHLEFHKELTCKFTLVKNLKAYCEQKKTDLNSIMPVQFLVDLDDDKCEQQMKKFSNFFLKNQPNRQRTKNSSTLIKKGVADFINKIKPLMELQSSGSDRKSKSNQFSKQKMHRSFENGDNYFWFLKPTGTNRGRGIQIFNSLEKLESYLSQYCVGMEEKPILSKNTKKETEAIQLLPGETEISPENQDNSNNPSNVRVNGNDASPSKLKESTLGILPTSTSAAPISLIKCRQFVVQKYVERPLLIRNRKFDIRAWVLITHKMEVYFFKESVIRTSGETFNLESNQIDNQFIHLTNNAVQRYADNYGTFESGNQLSLRAFFDYCKQAYPGCDTDKIHADMKHIVCVSMESVKKKIDLENRKYTFELYGFDFLLDDAFNVWLLEVNTNPCLDESSPHLEQVLPRLLDDAFKMTLDLIFPKTKILKKNYVQELEEKQPQKDIETPLKTESTTITNQSESAVAQMQMTQQTLPKTLIDIQQDTPFESSEKSRSSQQLLLTPMSESQVQFNKQSNEQATQINNEKYLPKKETNWKVDGFKDDENMWEFLLSIAQPPVKTNNSPKKFIGL